jgi:hypothetical protein
MYMCHVVVLSIRASVLRARCNEKGEEIEFSNSMTQLDEQQIFQQYVAKQDFMDSREVTHISALAISTHPAGVEGNVADVALELLKELLNGGNPNVQLSIFKYISEEDKDVKFLGHFKTRMTVSQDAIRV